MRAEYRGRGVPHLAHLIALLPNEDCGEPRLPVQVPCVRLVGRKEYGVRPCLCASLWA